MKLQGIGVACGVAKGTVLVLSAQRLAIPKNILNEKAAREAELQDFLRAHAETVMHTTALYQKALREVGESGAEIFDAHLAILNDMISVVDPIRELILTNGNNTAMATEQTLEEIAVMFERMESDYCTPRKRISAACQRARCWSQMT